MKYSSFKLHIALIALIVPVLACGPSLGQVTPTPTKTPIRERTVVSLPTVTLTPTSTPTPLPTDTPTVTPIPTDTPTPIPPTETPTPVPPTNTPVPPPPPPTDTPLPPTNTPPPPPPPQPPSSAPEVVVELPDGDVFDAGDEVKIIFIVRDPDGVDKFTWGIFLQNLTPLVGGDKFCGGATECKIEVEENAPPLTGTYIVGADAVDVHGNAARGTSAIYVP